MAHPYGSDLGGFYDIDKRLTFREGESILASDLLGRLLDKLWYDEDYGLDLERRIINSAAPALAQLPAEIEAELSKDERVVEVRATISPTQQAGEYTLEVAVVPSKGSSFSLVGAISSFGLEDFVIKRD